jgi:predicted acetyltransferase
VDIEFRAAGPDDLDEIARVDGASFAIAYEHGDIAEAIEIVGYDRVLLAIDDKRIVGIAGDYDFDMTVPGGARVAVPGVTWVSVSPTHRRRGILTGLMQRKLSAYAAAGASAAVLIASESGIYGRFGYGSATHFRTVTIDRRQATLRQPLETHGVSLVSPEEAASVLPELYERWRATVPGAVGRSDKYWDFVLQDKQYMRRGMTNRFYLVHPDGYVAYRGRSNWGNDHANHVCSIEDYVTVTPHAHAALWQVLLGLDLYTTIETQRMAVDDPLPNLLTDPRVVTTAALSDGMWVRPIDVSALLAARTYAVEIDLVLDVADEFFGDARYHLRGSPDGADCVRTERHADVSLGVASLGALSLGGQRVEPLAWSGLVQGEQAALTRLDRAFLSDRAPHHGTNF